MNYRSISYAAILRLKYILLYIYMVECSLSAIFVFNIFKYNKLQGFFLIKNTILNNTIATTPPDLNPLKTHNFKKPHLNAI